MKTVHIHYDKIYYKKYKNKISYSIKLRIVIPKRQIGVVTAIVICFPNSFSVNVFLKYCETHDWVAKQQYIGYLQRCCPNCPSYSRLKTTNSLT
jgi:hypothetical protein